MLKGILKQFRRTALASTRRGHLLGGMGKNIGQRALLAVRIQHDKMVEEPSLQGIGTTVALLSECRNVRFQCV